MSAAILLRSRLLLSTIFRRNARFLSTVKPYRPGYDEPQKILESETLPEPPVDSIPTPNLNLDAASASTSSVNNKNSPLGLLVSGLAAVLTGGAAVAGYATCAYSVDEIQEKATAWCSPAAMSNVADDASAKEKFQARLNSSAMTVSAKAADIYLDLRGLIEELITEYNEPFSEKLLPDMNPLEQGVITLVLDLNETLVHTDWKRERGWRTFKRPGVDVFLDHLSKFCEIVVYSDQLDVNPIVDRLDPRMQRIRYRLNRAATKYQDGKHYRDLSKLNRDPSKIIYLSGHALESSLQPENSVPITPWTLQADDTELLDLIPFLEYVATHGPYDTRDVLKLYQGLNVGKEFIRRQAELQRQMRDRKQNVLWNKMRS